MSWHSEISYWLEGHLTHIRFSNCPYCNSEIYLQPWLLESVHRGRSVQKQFLHDLRGKKLLRIFLRASSVS